MSEDKDFKLVTDNGKILYSNIDKICENLPEWNDELYCTYCRKPITTMKNINFFRWDTGKELWFKVFHEECYGNDTTKCEDEGKAV